jgi:hypothetical protein
VFTRSGREGGIRELCCDAGAPVLIVLSEVLTMSLVFVVVGGLATLLAYHLPGSLGTALAVGLLAGLTGWLGVSLVPDFFAGVQDSHERRG